MVSSIAREDVIATEEVWQVYHGVDTAGNALSGDQRSWLAQDAAGHAFQGTMETLFLAGTIYAGTALVQDAMVTQRQAASGNVLAAKLNEHGLAGINETGVA